MGLQDPKRLLLPTALTPHGVRMSSAIWDISGRRGKEESQWRKESGQPVLGKEVGDYRCEQVVSVFVC